MKMSKYSALLMLILACTEAKTQTEFKIRHSKDSILTQIPGKNGERFTQVIANNSVVLFLYAPRDQDRQQPHNRDEFYVVSEGAGTFICNGKSTSFKQGDLLFAPAGKEHRFVNFSDDLVVWVIFFGERTNSDSNKAIVIKYIQALNEHDVSKIISLQSPGHVFIDAYGTEMKGTGTLEKAWRDYFRYFQDYKIEISSVSEQHSEVVIFGFASASSSVQPTKHWKLPVAIRASVEEGKISYWQIYADTKVPFDLLDKR